MQVAPPRQRLTAWEDQERRRITTELRQATVVELLADNPSLLSEVLWRIRQNPEQLTPGRAERLGAERRTGADSISDPPAKELPSNAPQDAGRHRVGRTA